MALELRQFGLALGVAVLQGYLRETHCAEITWNVFSLLIEEWAQDVRIEPVLAKPLFVHGLLLDQILCVTMMLRCPDSRGVSASV